MSALITLVDPEVIEIGGLLGTIGRIYRSVPRKWPHNVIVADLVTMLVPAQCCVHAAAASAALLAQKQSDACC